jgi:hypothetical protein
MDKKLEKYPACLLIAITVLTSFLYSLGLDIYLSELDNPKLFKTAMLFSLGIAYFYCLQDGISGNALLDLATAGIIALIGIYFAGELREIYLEYLEFLEKAQDRDGYRVKDFIEHEFGAGSEYLSPLKHKTVGLGACLACSIALARLFCRKAILSMLGHATKQHYKPCPTCNK